MLRPMETVLDSVWVLVSAFLVFFMHAGFALVESGFCRKKNAVMVLLKNVGVVSFASILFFVLGFGLMFGEGNAFIGLSGFAPAADAAVAGAPDNMPLYVFLFFQLVFAATAATIVSGAVAERARLLTFFLFTSVASAVIYPIVGHWSWGGGFLSQMGFMDFAGSTVVHAVGGGMALAGAMIIGPRLGKYGKDGKPRPMPAHNFPLAALGVLVLWLGWFGFNGGSELAANPDAIGSIILVTNLAAAAGFIGALTHVRLRTGMLDLSMALNGALAGLVGITAGCNVIGPFESIVVGIIAGVLVVEGVFLLERMKIDDPVGAIAVHGINGIWGTVAIGFFGAEVGLFHGGGAGQLMTQLIGALAGTGFAFAAGATVWFALKLLPGGVRVEAQHELEGLDVSECGVEAYGEELKGVSQELQQVLPPKKAAATATATALVLAIVAVPGLADAQDAPLTTAEPAPAPGTAEEPSAPSGPTGSIGLDVSNHYFFRGIVQETRGVVFQPYLESGFTVYEGEGGLSSIGLSLGIWNSLHTEHPANDSGPGAWYESDLYAGVSLGLFDSLSLGVTYTAYTSPNGSFATVHELSGSLGYDDSSAWEGIAGGRFGGIQPSLTIARELEATAFGDSEGTYMELGIGPSVALVQSDSIELGVGVPVTVGTSLGDYYEDAEGDDFFGYLNAGLSLTAGLAFVPEQYGSWELSLGGSVLVLGDNLKTANEDRGTELLATAGLAVGY